VQQSVEKNLLLGATPLADTSRIAHLLERVYAVFPRLAERRKQQAGTMSGGERQMLAVGRALMNEPKLLLLDEPSLGLAPAVIESMYETIVRLHKEGLTLLLAEQSVDLALEVASYGYVLRWVAACFPAPRASCRGTPTCSASTWAWAEPSASLPSAGAVCELPASAGGRPRASASQPCRCRAL